MKGETLATSFKCSTSRAISVGFLVENDESGNWQRMSSDGNDLFIFDPGKRQWIAEKDTISKKYEMKTDQAGEVSSSDCPGANPKRISGFDNTVRVVNAMIPLHSTPNAIAENYIAVLPLVTKLEVIGERICPPFLDGANIWWKVRTISGIEGCAAEGSAISDLYYLETIN